MKLLFYCGNKARAGNILQRRFLCVTLPVERTAGSRVRTGLQRGGQLAHLCRFTTAADSCVCAASDTAVILLSAMRSGLFNIQGWLTDTDEDHKVLIHQVISI